MPIIVPQVPIAALTGDEKIIMDNLIDNLVAHMNKARDRNPGIFGMTPPEKMRDVVVSLIDKGYLKAFLHADSSVEWKVWLPHADRYAPFGGAPEAKPERN